MSDESPAFNLLSVCGVPAAGRCKRCTMPFAIGDDVALRVTNRRELPEGVQVVFNLIHAACPNPDRR